MKLLDGGTTWDIKSDNGLHFYALIDKSKFSAELKLFDSNEKLYELRLIDKTNCIVALIYFKAYWKK